MSSRPGFQSSENVMGQHSRHEPLRRSCSSGVSHSPPPFASNHVHRCRLIA
jgi:hypothetical protein